MNKIALRVTAGVVAASVGLLAFAATPVAAKTKPKPKKPTYTIDPIMKNDIKWNSSTGAIPSGLLMTGSSFEAEAVE